MRVRAIDIWAHGVSHYGESQHMVYGLMDCPIIWGRRAWCMGSWSVPSCEEGGQGIARCMGSWSVPLCEEGERGSAWCMGSWSVPLCEEGGERARGVRAHGVSHYVKEARARVVYGLIMGVPFCEGGRGSAWCMGSWSVPLCQRKHATTDIGGRRDQKPISETQVNIFLLMLQEGRTAVEFENARLVGKNWFVPSKLEASGGQASDLVRICSIMQC